jgi:hypothetical protein
VKYRAAVALLLMARTALADPPVQAIPPGDDKIVVVHEGEKVPFTGQLYDNSTALRWGNWLQQYKVILALTTARDQQVCQAKLDFDTKTTAIEKLRTDGIEKDLRARLTQSEQQRLQLQQQIDHPPFYREFWFQAGVGVVVTLGATYAAAKVLSSH